MECIRYSVRGQEDKYSSHLSYTGDLLTWQAIFSLTSQFIIACISFQSLTVICEGVKRCLLLITAVAYTGYG